MTELDRFFRRLVESLAAMDPGRLHRPMTVADVSRRYLPYRTNRRSLGIDTNEDYDGVLLRLLAGEGGYLHMLSDDIRRRFDRELNTTNPDLAVLGEFAGAELTLDTEALAHALGPGPEGAYAPPEPMPEHTAPPPAADRPTAANSDLEIPLDPVRYSMPPVDLPAAQPRRSERGHQTGDDPDGRCGFCGARLPAGRTIHFCPYCGQNQAFTRCPECRSEIELGWRHCVNCGHLVGE
jgi:hypothetical protein